MADDINHRVVKLNPQLGFLGAWGGFGSKPGQLAFPRALAADPAGDTYVADTANDRVEVLTPSGNYLRTIGTSARGPGELTAPRGLATDPTGRLLVSDTVGNRIELFAPGTDSYLGQWTAAGGHAGGLQRTGGDRSGPARARSMSQTRATAGLCTPGGDGTFLGELGGPADLGGAQLSGAGSVALADGPDETYVADTAHNRVLVYGPEGSLREKWGAAGGNGAAGHGSGEFDHPDAVAVDGAGNAYVADTYNNRIVKLSTNGVGAERVGLARPRPTGTFTRPPGSPSTLPATCTWSTAKTTASRCSTPKATTSYQWGVRGFGIGEFSQPTAVAVDCNGDVYVADTNNNRVERFNLGSASGPAASPRAPGRRRWTSRRC